MLKKIILIIAGIVFLTGSAGITVQNDGYKKQKSKMESFDAIDNKYHIDGEGFYYVGKMLKKRAGHTATLLQDGRVFIAGGWSPLKHQDLLTFPITRTTEIFDPKTGTSVPGPDLHRKRMDHRAFLMSDGRVLIYGGDDSLYPSTLIEVYNPKTSTIQIVGEYTKDFSIEKQDSFVDYINEDEIAFGNRYKFCIYNTKTNTIGFTDSNIGYNYCYDGRINNTFYLTVDSAVIKIAYKGNGRFEEIPFGNEADYIPDIDGKSSILLKDGKHILLIGRKGLAIFSTETNNISHIYKEISLEDMDSSIISTINAFLLKNGNVLVSSFNLEHQILLTEICISESSDRILGLSRKNYLIPNRIGTATELENGRILFSGDFVGSKNSDKVYVWRRKEIKS